MRGIIGGLLLGRDSLLGLCVCREGMGIARPTNETNTIFSIPRDN